MMSTQKTTIGLADDIGYETKSKVKKSKDDSGNCVTLLNQFNGG